MHYIFFDVDGVLINGLHYNPAHRVWWDEHIEQDLGIDRAQFKKEFFGPDFKEVITGKRDLIDMVREYLPRFSNTITAEQFVRYWLEKDSNINQDLLDQIKRIKDSGQARLFIATNQMHERADYLMNELGFNVLFEDIFHSARAGAMKTNPAYYDYVHKTLPLPHDVEPIFFDDTPEVVEAARAVGWDAYQFDTADCIKQSEIVCDILNINN